MPDITQSDSLVARAVEDMVRFGQACPDEVTQARIRNTCLARAMAYEHASNADLARIEADIRRSEELTANGDVNRRSAYIRQFYKELARATRNS